MMKKVKSIVSNEEGSAIGLFIVFILSMTLLATASVTLAQTQYNWSKFSRQTSNSYHLARSGAEKVVDSMNKEVTKVLPALMKKASEITHNKLMGTNISNYEGVKYKSTDIYTGKYVGYQYDNEYEIQLKRLIYNHIVELFINNPPIANEEKDYEATKSDIKKPINIHVKTKVYKFGSYVHNSPELSGIVAGLLREDEIGIEDKDAFAVEVLAWAEEDEKTPLTKSKIVGTISLDQANKSEQLLEEYQWANAYSEALQSAVLSFGDFIINGEYEAKIEGDITVKGTTATPTTIEQLEKNICLQPDYFGGIVVSDGGNLKVEGNALVVNNIQTTNSKYDSTRAKKSKIEITKDAIADTIAINDNSSESDLPWETMVSNNMISIGRNAYLDNDLRIDRYTKNGQINIGNSVFGISDGDKNGIEKDGKVYVDPNKSSGIYAMGKLEDDDSKIKMARAFIAGQAFINFGDNNGFHKLYESAGEPFDDVYYLDDYRESYTRGQAGDITGGDNGEYINDLKELINKNRIEITDNYAGKKHAYAPAFISANGEIHDVSTGIIGSQAEARGIFYAGINGAFSDELQNILSSDTDWKEVILSPVEERAYRWEKLIENPKDYYEGNNPFKKDYFMNHNSSVSFDDLLAYKGLQGYMLVKRGVFYQHFVDVEDSTTGLIPKGRSFDDLIYLDAFTEACNWEKNNPIMVIVDEGITDINISDYDNIPTAIICTESESILRLGSKSGQRKFTGIIITPGKIIIDDKMIINGVVIAGNEKIGRATTQDIRQGEHAGIQVDTQGPVIFKYDIKNQKDRDIIFEIRFMDKSLQRKLFDCLKMTKYWSAIESTKSSSNNKERIEAIFGPDEKRQVKLSQESVISSEQDGLQFMMKSLKKIKN